MRVQVVKFPDTPQATEEKVKELRPMIDAYFAEIGQVSSEHLSSELLVMSWHQATIDFVELMDGTERVGLLMNIIETNPLTQTRTVRVLTGYVDPAYRGKGAFKQMLDYAKVIYQARQMNRIEIIVPSEHTLTFGDVVAKVQRVEL